jgi:hypothetical protein
MTSRDVLPVITLILGSVLTVLGGLFAETHRNKWAREKEREDRAVERRLETTAFQRDTLLQLQDAGQDLLDSTFECFVERWNKIEEPAEAEVVPSMAHPVAAETDRRRRSARLQTEKLLVRVEDDRLRELGQRLTQLSADIISMGNYTDARPALTELQEGFREANSILGKHLRSLLKGDLEAL